MPVTLNVYDADINLGDSDSKKLYLKAIAVDSDVKKYDLSPTNFEMFLNTLREKVNDFKLNRNNNFSLDKNRGAAGTTPEYVSLLDCYGDVDLNHVYNKSREVWYGNNANIQQTQDTLRRNMSYLVIRNLLTAEARQELMIHDKHFIFDEYGDGMCFFKLIVQKVNPTSRSSIVAMKKQLRELDLKQVKYNISKGNVAFESTYKSITRQGGSHDDIEIDLFAYYHTAKNPLFKDFVSRLEEKYQEGDAITYIQMMEKAETKYNNLLSAKKWDYSDDRDAKIIALTTLVNDMYSKINGNKSGKNRFDKKDDENTDRASANRKEWTTPPAEGGSEVKMIGKKEVRWCAKCRYGKGMWTTTHDTATHQKKNVESASATKPSNAPATTSNNDKVNLNPSLQAALNTLCGDVGIAESDDEALN